MNTLIIIILSILFYVIGGIAMWSYIHYAHSKNGIWNNLYPDSSDIFMTFCPVVNWFGVMIWLSFWPLNDNHKISKKIENRATILFKIKK